jgi:hypothetical protein
MTKIRPTKQAKNNRAICDHQHKAAMIPIISQQIFAMKVKSVWVSAKESASHFLFI